MSNSDAIGRVAPGSETFVWATRGFWRQQHDPDPLPSGRILVFDDSGTVGPTAGSRLLEFDPVSNAVTWSHEGRRGEPIWSIGRRSQQTLPNGTILVAESAGGRIVEITRSGDIVWECFSPKRRRTKGRAFSPIICSALRFRPAAPTFLD